MSKRSPALLCVLQCCTGEGRKGVGEAEGAGGG